MFRSIPETGKVIFLGDPAKPGAKNESLPGDDYPQAAESPGLPATVGSLQDNWVGYQDALFRLLRDPQKPAAAAAGPAAVRARHRSLHVLLVEDNAVNQRLMQKVLMNRGCQWTLAENGRRALEELSRDHAHFDVVVMDLHLPELDGLAAIAEIRAGKAGDAAKTVWISARTADARDDQRERARAAGANDYLTKSLKLADLERTRQRFRAARK